MSFFFSRGRTRGNTNDLPKQARDHVLKLDGPAGAAKVCPRILVSFRLI